MDASMAVGKLLRGIAKATVFGVANPEGTIRNHWKMYRAPSRRASTTPS